MEECLKSFGLTHAENKDRTENYARMSFALAYVILNKLVYEKELLFPEECTQYLHQRAPIVLVQMVARILVQPSAIKNGSQPDELPAESIAYDTLTLLCLTALPFMDVLNDEIQTLIGAQRQELTSALDDGNLTDTAVVYSLAALKKDISKPPKLDEKSAAFYKKMAVKLLEISKHYLSVEYMNGESFVSIKASLLEATFYSDMLKFMRADIFPRTLAPEKDKYLDYIPPMFTFQSTYFEKCFAPQWLFDIMLWSMFIFLVDEFMESNVELLSSHDLQNLKDGLQKIHPDPDPRYSIIRISQLESLGNEDEKSVMSNLSPSVQMVLTVLYRWVNWVMNWDRVALSSNIDLNEFRYQIRSYLLYHVHQLEDNARLSAQQDPAATNSTTTNGSNPTNPSLVFRTPRTSYSTWTHTVGGGHISAPVSLAFAACYMGTWVRSGGGRRRNGWSSVMQSMLVYEVNVHVAGYCRMYNDYGSMTRDTAEKNLNSINFPEFWSNNNTTTTPIPHAPPEQRKRRPSNEAGESDTDDDAGINRAKAQLLEIAQHERAMADILAQKFYASLEREGEGEGNAGEEGRRISGAMRVYFRSGELFSDMYLTRDVTNRVSSGTEKGREKRQKIG